MPLPSYAEELKRPTAPDAKAVEAAIQQVKVTSDIVRAVPAVDAWLKHLKVVVDAAQAYLDAQKAEPVACAHISASTLLATLHPSNAAIGAFEYADAMFAAEKKS